MIWRTGNLQNFCLKLEVNEIISFKVNMKKNIKKIFSDIEKIRSKNNKTWMDILRLSFESNPKKTFQIITQILNKDKKLISLAQKLKKYTK